MSKLKNKSLGLKIGELITAKAKFDSDDENEDTRAKVVDAFEEESDDDVRGSSLRTKNVQLLDKLDRRYAGKKVSRTDIYKSDFNSDQSEDENSEGSINEKHSVDEDSAEEGNSAEEGDSAEEDANSEDQSENDEAEDSYEDESTDGEEESENEDTEKKLKLLPDLNVEEEIKKGNSVRDQIKVWENLLDMRIKFQKCLQISNRLPQSDLFKQFTVDNDFKNESKKVQSGLSSLLDKLLELNTVLSNKIQNENGTSENDEEILSESEDEEKGKEKESEVIEEAVPKKKRKLSLSTFEKLITNSHNSYTSHRNAEIKKWNDKTRIASNVSSKKSQIPILQQIDFILKDKPKLVKKTQLKRSEYEIIGKEVSENVDGRRIEEYDPEIYDDDDFYHELLREFIHQKTSGITDPTQLSKQWVQLQSMRNKLKRKIDTRATKGRRLRYNVHQKLVNYMAPVLVNDTMTDQAKDELYNSLFSQTKTSN